MKCSWVGGGRRSGDEEEMAESMGRSGDFGLGLGFVEKKKEARDFDLGFE
jgi:hypothetical protein